MHVAYGEMPMSKISTIKELEELCKQLERASGKLQTAKFKERAKTLESNVTGLWFRNRRIHESTLGLRNELFSSGLEQRIQLSPDAAYYLASDALEFQERFDEVSRAFDKKLGGHLMKLPGDIAHGAMMGGPLAPLTGVAAYLGRLGLTLADAWKAVEAQDSLLMARNRTASAVLGNYKLHEIARGKYELKLGRWVVHENPHSYGVSYSHGMHETGLATDFDLEALKKRIAKGNGREGSS